MNSSYLYFIFTLQVKKIVIVFVNLNRNLQTQETKY